jgi:hypothetical protein
VNLFLATRRLTDAKEDHLTDFLAAALEMDRTFRDAYFSAVLQAFCVQQGWAGSGIEAVKTQRNYPGTGCCPDLEVTLSGGQVVLCEHKIEAPETLGAEGEDEVAVRQLERYLRLPVDGVAYFRSTWKTPSDAVLDHPKYVKPKAREHFLWRDLYPALQIGTTDVTRWLTEAFESLGYTPAHPSVGDLADRDDAVRSANKQNFAKLWQRTRSSLRELGWRVEAGSVCELYLRSHGGAAAREIYVSPLRESGRILLIRVTPDQEDSVASVKRRLDEAAKIMRVAPRIETVLVPRGQGQGAGFRRRGRPRDSAGEAPGGGCNA